MNRKERRAKQKQQASPAAQAQQLYNQGIQFYNLGKFGQAFESLKKASALQKTNPDFLYSFGTIALALGKRPEAFEALQKAVALQPDNHQFVSQLANAAQGLKFNVFDKKVKDTITFCLKKEKLSQQTFAKIWISLLQLDKSLAPIFKIDAATKFSDIPQTKFEQAITDEFLLLGLKRLITQNYEMEAWLTLLRQKLFDYLIEEKGNDKNVVELASILAQHCFLNEYVFYITEKEEQKIAALKTQIENEAHTASDIVAYALYEQLSLLKNTKTIEDNYKDSEIAPLITQQLRHYFIEQDLKSAIQSLVPISDQTSKDVQEMYEENPYPRWESIPATTRTYESDKGDYLIAGCGTGRSPCTMANVMDKIKITGIDLSRVSLAYAQRKANEFGFKNLELIHLDILNIEKLDHRYDAIECGGVLHHMKDPIEGWRSLLKVLAPGGRMLIGLYSENARKNIVGAQDFAKEKGLSGSAKDIREFRKLIFELPDDNPIKTVSKQLDFYSISSCRDLCFHIQEARYTLPELKQVLEDLDLECVGFMPNFAEIATMYKQQFPDDPQMKDFDNWEKLEQKRPDICIGMYNFWCKRKADKDVSNDVVKNWIDLKMIPG